MLCIHQTMTDLCVNLHKTWRLSECIQAVKDILKDEKDYGESINYEEFIAIV